jgi:hypothetical protein
MDHGEGLRRARALVLEVDLLWLAPEVAMAVGLDLVVEDRLGHLLVKRLHSGVRLGVVLAHDGL